ncbi:helix-turn-helix domain-containing protein [Halosolutus amylolyticus]|uniref:Helix-turn-helix domain-containing protein n=1 Tax=Halosolutus amylolyticus TaxID=2932267 RepID=A0ABD5PVN3_9EURY|nr:helix-turn-helix domain-containing protein [Halosolutus amylolyticus]
MESIQIDSGGAEHGRQDSIEADPPDSFASLSRDSLFEVLSNARRRSIIAYLNGTDTETVTVRDLAEQIAAWENGISVAEVTYKERKRVYTSLYQLHLEKLHRLGIVRYDQDRGIVEQTPITAQLESYLDTDVDDEDDGGTWARLSLAISTGCAVIVLLAWVLPVGSVNGFGIASLIAVAFLVVSIAQVLDEHDG